MRRRPTPIFLLPLLSLIFILQDPPRCSGFKVTQEDSPFVVFSSFPSFQVEEGGGAQSSIAHGGSAAAVPGGHNERETFHDGSSTSRHGVPLSISEVDGLTEIRDTTRDKDDAPDTGIFLFSALMKGQQDKSLSSTVVSATPVASDATISNSDISSTPNKPTAAPVIVYAKEVATFQPSGEPQIKSSDSQDSEGVSHPLRKHSQSVKSTNEHEAEEVPASGDSLASTFRRLQPSFRHGTRSQTEEQEQDRDLAQQMSLAERLKALQERRNQRHGSQTRQDNDPLPTKNPTLGSNQRSIQHRIGELFSSAIEGNITGQKKFAITVEPADTFVGTLSEDGAESRQNAKEIPDLIVEEASLITTTFTEQPTLATSTSISAPSPSVVKPRDKKPERLTYTQRLRARLQKLRERRLGTASSRPRNPRPNNSARPQAEPRPKPKNNTRLGQVSRNNTSLSASQRRRQQLLNRLKNRNSNQRPQINTSTSDPQNEDSAVTPKSSLRRVPSRRPSLVPTTARPLSLREKIEQFRRKNRFVPSSRRKQTTTTTATTTSATSTTTETETTTTPSTTSTTSTTTAPTTTYFTTTQPPTTIRTTLGFALNTWPVTQEPDEDNLLITIPSTTDASDDRRIQIRKLIDAMLSAKGEAGTTTTEQILSFLEEATSKPVFIHTTNPPYSRKDQSISPRPAISTGKKDRTKVPFFNFRTTTTESSILPLTTRPSTSRIHEQPNLSQRFSSLADKLAVSNISKKSKFHPTTTTTSTSPRLPLGDETFVTDQPVTSFPELSTVDSDLRGAFDRPLEVVEDTNKYGTTVAQEMETVTFMPSVLPTTGMDNTSPATLDDRVQNLISKLLAQGVITTDARDESPAVTHSMDDIQSTTQDPDTLSYNTEEDQAPSITSTDSSALGSDKSKDTETEKPDESKDFEIEKSTPSTAFKLPHHLEEPQLTRGAPLTRNPLPSDIAFVYPITTMDTTVMDDMDMTEDPSTTILGDIDTISQTSPPDTHTETSTINKANDGAAENEINSFNSKNNLHSLIRIFDQPLVRPELAAVNQVLGFSLTTDDMPGLVEVNLEKPLSSGDFEDIDYDMETAATEQVMITTNFFEERDLTSTPSNSDIKTLQVSESSHKTQDVTEATNLLSMTETSTYAPTSTETQPQDNNDMVLSTEEPNRVSDSKITTEVDATTEYFRAFESPMQTPTSEIASHQMKEKDSDNNAAAPGSITAIHNNPQMSNTRFSQRHGGSNDNSSLQTPLHQDVPRKTENLFDTPETVYQGVSQAVLRERLHLLRLVKERQDGRLDAEIPEPFVTISKATVTTSKPSLSELLNKRTSGEKVKELAHNHPKGIMQPKQEIVSEVSDTHPVDSTATLVKQAKIQDEAPNKRTSEAMRRFLQLNKHAIEALRAKNKTPSKAESPAPPAGPTPPTIISITRSSNSLLPSRPDSKGDSPVITEVTPRSQINHSDIPEETKSPNEGTRRGVSSLLKPAVQVSQQDNISSHRRPHTPDSPTSDHHFSTPIPDPDIADPTRPATRSGISPLLHSKQPHSPPKFTIMTKPHQESSLNLPPLSEGVVESPEIVGATLRPLTKPISTEHSHDSSTMDRTTNGPNFNLDESTDVPKTLPELHSFDVQTERPDDDGFTTLASLLMKKQFLNTDIHHTRHDTDSLPNTKNGSTFEATDDILAPVTLTSQKTPTRQQLDDEVNPTLILQNDPVSVNIRDKTDTPPSEGGAFSAAEEVTDESVPSPFNFLDTTKNLQTRFKGISEGTFRLGSPFSDASVGVPLPLPGLAAPQADFPTTVSTTQFQPTVFPPRFPVRIPEETSFVTDFPFSTNPVDFETEAPALPPSTLIPDLDITGPGTFSFKVLHNPTGISHTRFSSPSGVNDDIFTTGGDILHGGPTQNPSLIITPEPDVASFTLGHNEAFFTDKNHEDKTLFLPVSEIPFDTTPITTITPQVRLVTQPAVKGPAVTADTLVPETTTISFLEEHKTHSVFSPSTTTINSPDLQPKDSLSHPQDLVHMITQGVTITSTEGVIDRRPPLHKPEPEISSHSDSLLLSTDSPIIHVQQQSSNNVIQRDNENFRTETQSASFPLFEDTEQRSLPEKEILRQPQQRQHQDEIHRPNLQGGHINLNEFHQHHREGQLIIDEFHGIQTQSGQQRHQNENQMLLKQQSFHRGNEGSNRHTFLQNRDNSQTVQGHRTRNHQLPQVQQTPSQQHTFEQRKGAVDQHSVVSQHTLKPGHGVLDKTDTVNQHSLVQDDLLLPGHRDINEHTFSKVHGIPVRQVTDTQDEHQDGTEKITKQDMNVHIKEQEKVTLTQHNEHTEQSNLNEPHSQGHIIQDQHDSEGHITESQQQNVHGHIIHDQANPQGEVTQGQDNDTGHHTVDFEESIQGETTQDNNQQGPIPQGHLTLQVHQSTQEQVIQGHQDSHGQVIQGHQDSQGQIIQGHQDSQGQVIQGHRDNHEQVIQGHHDTQGHVIQGHQHSQGQVIQGHQDNHEQVIQDHQDIPGQVIAEHQDAQGQDIQDHQDSQGQAIQGHQDIHGQVNEEHQDAQGQVIQGHQEIQGKVIQGHQDIQGQSIQSHQETQGQVIQGHQDTQGQVIQDHRDTQGQTIQGHQDIQGQVIQGHQDTQGQVILGHRDAHGQVIQGHQEIQGQVIQGHQDIQGQVILGHRDAHGQVIQDQQDTQFQSVLGQHGSHDQVSQVHQNIHGHIVEGHQFSEGITEGQQDTQHQVGSSHQDTHGHITQGHQFTQEQKIQSDHDVRGEITGDQHDTQGQVILGHQDTQVQITQGHQDDQVQTIQIHQSSQGESIQGQSDTQEQTIQVQPDIQGEVIQGHQDTQEHILKDHQNTQGQVVEAQHGVQEEIVYDQDITHTAHEDDLQGESTQTLTDQTVNTFEKQQTISRSQQEQPQHGSGMGEPVVTERDDHSHRTTVAEEDVAHETIIPETSTFHGHERGGETVTLKQEQRFQSDVKHSDQEETHRQVQQSSQHEHTFRRGKFISGDEVIKSQQTIDDKQSSQGHATVRGNVHGSRGTFLGAARLVPATQTEHRGRERQEQSHSRTSKNGSTTRQNARSRTKEQNKENVQLGGSERSTSRGRNTGQDRRQDIRSDKQKTTGEEAEGSRQAYPRNRGSIGHFTNSAAGFLQGPANSFISGFASLEASNPTNGGDRGSPSTDLPTKTKVMREGHRARMPMVQDPDNDEIPGRAGIDYPDRSNIPNTTFVCASSMTNMMFADPETDCQVYHVCSDHQRFSFLCPKGTLFNQDTSVCQWWFTVDCARQARRLAEVRALATP